MTLGLQKLPQPTNMEKTKKGDTYCIVQSLKGNLKEYSNHKTC